MSGSLTNKGPIMLPQSKNPELKTVNLVPAVRTKRLDTPVTRSSSEKGQQHQHQQQK